MPAPETLLDLYLNLAEVSEPRPAERESFLVLAASAAELAGQQEAAEACRSEVVRLNPRHFLAGFESMGLALQSDDVIERTEALYRTYHFERAEFLLDRLRFSESPQDEHAPAFAAEMGMEAGGARSPASIRAKARPRRQEAPTVEAYPQLRPEVTETRFAAPETQVPLGAAIVLSIVTFAVGFLLCGTLQLLVK